MSLIKSFLFQALMGFSLVEISFLLFLDDQEDFIFPPRYLVVLPLGLKFLVRDLRKNERSPGRRGDISQSAVCSPPQILKVFGGGCPVGCLLRSRSGQF